MIKRLLILVIVMGFLFQVYFCIIAQAADARKKSVPDDGRAIEIISNRFEADNERRMVIFTGNAVATQGDRVIKAENIFLYYAKEKGSTGKGEWQGLGKTGELERIEAKGQVTITQGDRVVTGERAVYYRETQKIVMTGNAVMRQGDSLVQGDRIEVFLNENKGVVEAAENKRVKATIYPVEKGSKK
jgi:lipopolysaccharide export system protein LptA